MQQLPQDSGQQQVRLNFAVDQPVQPVHINGGPGEVRCTRCGVLAAGAFCSACGGSLRRTENIQIQPPVNLCKGVYSFFLLLGALDSCVTTSMCGKIKKTKRYFSLVLRFISFIN